MKSVTHNLLNVGMAIVSVTMFLEIATFTVVRGQSAATPATRGRTDPVQRELLRRVESEAIESALAASPRRRAEHDWRMSLAQIREDFLHIQIINDDLRRFASGSGARDLKLIAKAASEITKRAERLRDNLALPEIEKTSEPSGLKVETGMEQLSLSLSLLSNSIDRFVENPVFEKSRVVDARLSAQARRDLEQILKVSKQLKRNSEKLQRAKGRPVRT